MNWVLGLIPEIKSWRLFGVELAGIKPRLLDQQKWKGPVSYEELVKAFAEMIEAGKRTGLPSQIPLNPRDIEFWRDLK